MSKDKTQSTPTSEYNYLEEAKKNQQLADQWLETVFPEFYEAKRLMDLAEIDYVSLIEFITALRPVKEHGWGNVQIHIQSGDISRYESKIIMLKNPTTEKTLPKR